MRTLRILTGCGAFLLACSLVLTAQSVQTDYDRKSGIASFKTFAFYPQERKPGDPLAASPLNDRRIHDALDAQLKAKGLLEADGALPDFYVAYYVSTREGLDIQDNRFGILNRSGSVNVNKVTEGTLVVVFVDAATQQEVWRGAAAGTIVPRNLESDVNKSVAKLVDQFAKDRAAKKK